MGRKEKTSFHPYISAIFAAIAESGGELGAAFGATASQDLTAVGSGHSLSEAMDFGSVPLSGLIGTNSCHIRKHLLLKYAQQLLSQPQRMDTVHSRKPCASYYTV